MIRALAAALLLIWVSLSAHAQPAGCPNLQFSWTTPYQTGTIQSVSYAVDTLNMQVLFFSQVISLYANVPLSVAQASTKTNTSADGWYNSQVKGRYAQAILAEAPSCPLLNEQTGAFILSQ